MSQGWTHRTAPLTGSLYIWTLETLQATLSNVPCSPKSRYRPVS